MGKKLSTKRINSRYKDEWVLLLNPEISSETEIKGGELLFHSKNREEVHKRLLDFKGNKAIVFAGKIPEEVGVLL